MGVIGLTAEQVVAIPSVRLSFEGTEWDGLEVWARKRVPLSTFLYFQPFDSSVSPSELFSAFRRWGDEVLLDWNLSDESGTTVPANGDGMLSTPDGGLASLLLYKWRTAVAEPTPALLDRLEKWKLLGGGLDENGAIITKPVELNSAELIDVLCKKYHCLPGQIENEDVSVLMNLNILNYGQREADRPAQEFEEEDWLLDS